MSENTEEIKPENVIVEIPLIGNGDFVTKHQDEIKIITDSVISVIKSCNINVNVDTINTSQILRIISEINKTINKMKTLKKELEEMPASDKAGILFAVTTEVINSPEVSSHLSPAVKNKILDFTENGQAVNEIANIVDWVSDEVLEGYDINQDGVITEAEIAESCNKSCSCCPKSCGSCWAKFFIGFLCCGCGKKEINTVN
jgi:Ca2+-binding EF-hand superfamily protein